MLRKNTSSGILREQISPVRPYSMAPGIGPEQLPKANRDVPNYGSDVISRRVLSRCLNDEIVRVQPVAPASVIEILLLVLIHILQVDHFGHIALPVLAGKSYPTRSLRA